MAVRDRRDILRALYTPGSRKFWALKTDSARVLYGALVANSDDEGRLEGASEDVRALIPRSKYTLQAIETDLEDMRHAGLVRRYRAKGKTYIEVIGFVDCQHWHGVSRDASAIPAPPNRRPKMVVKATISDAADHRGVPSLHSRIDSKKEQREKGEEKGERGKGSGSYKTFAIRYATLAGRHPSRQKDLVGAYDQLCVEFGEDRVLGVLDVWAEGRGGREGLKANRWAARDFLKHECEELLTAGAGEQRGGDADPSAGMPTAASIAAEIEKRFG